MLGSLLFGYGLRVFERDKRAVELEGTAVFQKRCRQVVIDNVICQPNADVAVELGGKGAVGLPKRLDGPKAVLRVGATDTAEQLVEVDKGKGERGFLHVAGTYLCAPGKVAAKLPVAHGVVRGRVGFEGSLVGTIVFEIGHEGCLKVEKLILAKPPSAPAVGTFLPARNGAHLAVAVWHIRGHLAPCEDDGFVVVARRREM